MWRTERQLEAARPWGLAITDLFFSAVCKNAHVPGPHACLYAFERYLSVSTCLSHAAGVCCSDATVLSVLLDPLVGADFNSALQLARQNVCQDIVVINAPATVAEVKGHAIITRCATKKCTATLQVTTTTVAKSCHPKCRSTSARSMVARWRLCTT
jgi:hypothetical protein